MFDTIVVPVDLGHQEHADRMIKAAQEVANEGSKIILLNVVEVLPEYALSYVPGEAISEIENDTKKMLKDLNAKYGGNFEVMMESGHAGDTIVQVSEDTKADAIVIASHKPGFADYFIGSTAARVVRHAKCSVLVLR